MLAQKIELHKTRDFSNKLNATIEFIKENFKPLCKSMLYIAGPFVILGSLFITKIFGDVFLMIGNDMSGVGPDESQLINMGVFGLGAVIFLLLGSTVLIAVVYEYIIIYEKQGAGIEVGEVYARVKKSFWSVLGTMVLYAVLFVAAYILLIIPAAVLGSLNPVLTIFSVLAFYIGAMYVAVTFSLVFIIRIYEGAGFTTAFRRSFKLIKGKWWSTFGLLLVTSLIQSVISSIFFIPWYANLIVHMMHNMEAGVFAEPSLIFQIINYTTLLLYMVSNYLLYSIPLLAIAFQYFNLAEMKEARGLMDKINTFGVEGSQVSDDEEHY